MCKKIASLTVAFNEEDLIGGCLDLLDVDYKLVLIPIKTFSGNSIVNFDDTEKIAKKKGAVVLFTDLTKEYDVRNYGLNYLKNLGYDYSLIVDADEYWPLETQRKIIQIISEKPADAYKAQLDFFFKRPNWKIDSMPNRKAVIAVKTNKKFSSARPRKFHGKIEFIDPGIIYHFSYVRKPEKIKEKILSFSHSEEINKDWYDKVFLPFTPDFKNFHPIKPKEYPSCVVCELPEEIKSKIPNHLWSV